MIDTYPGKGKYKDPNKTWKLYYKELKEKYVVALFYSEPEAELPLIIILPQEVDKATYLKLKDEFKNIIDQMDLVNSGTAPDRYYNDEEIEEIKLEYTQIHRGEPIYPLDPFTDKSDIIEFFDGYDEFEDLNEENVISFIQSRPKLMEKMEMSSTEDIFIEKHSLYDRWSMGMGYVPPEINRLRLK